MGELMSDVQLRRRRKLQSKIGRTTSTLGLGGAAIGVGAVLGSKNKGALKAIRKVPGLKRATPEGMKEAGLYTGLASGGIGGVGGFNAASIYSDEARRRQQSVKKELGMDMGYFGEEGHPVTLEPIEVEVEKAWSPVASNYDPEASRHKRAQIGEPVLAGVGVGGVGGAAYAKGKSVKLRRMNNTPGQRTAAGFPRVKAAQAAREVSAVKHGKAAAALGAAGAVGLGGAAVVHHGRRHSWQSYAKRDNHSAFGIDHESTM